ncbi:MAG: Rrf2 family transcriptional regulator [Thermoguttaceae bacterium]|nr:Rrf2 family transcriptional regulator [Thermoguttaceae bacterium]
MRASTKAFYGVLALADIALNSDNGSSVPAPDIAERQDVSKKYLEQILSLLRRAGYVRAQRGINGGYSLARPANSITLFDIFDALDSAILERTEIGGKRADAGLRDVVNACLWEKINDFLVSFAKSMTLEDFIGECKKRTPETWDLYVI